MKKLFNLMFVLTLILTAMTLKIPINASYSIDLSKKDDTSYEYNASQAGFKSDYSNTLSPSYYIYAGMMGEEEAEKLIVELGMVENINQWAATVKVITPINGNDYNEEDSKLFIDTLGNGVSNAKVIGINKGATFVNNYISQQCFAIAGMMIYGGEMREGLDYNVPVPVYLAKTSQIASDYYIKANEATKFDGTIYINENNTLQQVVIDDKSTLKQVFEKAWESIFSKNYRQHNEQTECYMSSPKVQKDPYPLIEIANFEQLNIIYNAYYNEPLNNTGQYTWFEYIPSQVLKQQNKTIPLVISLHGNGNDARLQGDTSGWPELASKENFIVVAPEWQDVVINSETHEPGPNYFNCDGLEGDKLIEWINMLKVKYPQIDPSRIYITGLSAGGSASSLYGVKYNPIFAAVGAVSAPGVDKGELAKLADSYTGSEVPLLYICGDYDFFGIIPVDSSSENSFQVAPGVYLQTVDPNVSIFSMIQSYQKINHLPISENYDMSLNKYYGISLDNEQWIKMGNKNTLEGSVSNENGLIFKFAAIQNQAHWNYKPEAEYIWNFFKEYKRDVSTGELIRVNQPQDTTVNENQAKDNIQKEVANTSDISPICASFILLIISSCFLIKYRLKQKTES